MNSCTQTSLHAFVAIRKELPKRRAEVLRAIQSLGGKASSFEIAEWLNLPLHSVSGRITELAATKDKNGNQITPKIVDSGERRQKTYRNGLTTSFIVWRLMG